MELPETIGSHNKGNQAREATAPVLGARLIGVEDVAAYLGTSTWTVRRLMDGGHLKRVVLPLGRKDCRRLLFDKLDLERLVDSWKDAVI
jgi:hypothetical protein